jgi:hypothetical protein
MRRDFFWQISKKVKNYNFARIAKLCITLEWRWMIQIKVTFGKRSSLNPKLKAQSALLQRGVRRRHHGDARLCEMRAEIEWLTRQTPPHISPEIRSGTQPHGR